MDTPLTHIVRRRRSGRMGVERENAHCVRSHTCHNAHNVHINPSRARGGWPVVVDLRSHLPAAKVGRQATECTTMKNGFPSAIWVVLAPFWPLAALGLAYAAVYATRM